MSQKFMIIQVLLEYDSKDPNSRGRLRTKGSIMAGAGGMARSREALSHHSGGLSQAVLSKENVCCIGITSPIA